MHAQLEKSAPVTLSLTSSAPVHPSTSAKLAVAKAKLASASSLSSSSSVFGRAEARLREQRTRMVEIHDHLIALLKEIQADILAIAPMPPLDAPRIHQAILTDFVTEERAQLEEAKLAQAQAFEQQRDFSATLKEVRLSVRLLSLFLTRVLLFLPACDRDSVRIGLTTKM